MENYSPRYCPYLKAVATYRRNATAPVNLAPSPFHFSYFFQNVNIGHGGILATIAAYYAVRSGEAYR